MAKLILNKKDFLEYINNLKDPNAQGKALGLTLGTTIAGGTIGALTGEVLGNPFGGAAVGATLGSAAGAYKSKKYFTEASESKPEKSQNVPCKGIKEKKGFSCKEELFRGKPTGKFFITTHRARSKSYDSFDKIPQSVINFIDSTG